MSYGLPMCDDKKSSQKITWRCYLVWLFPVTSLIQTGGLRTIAESKGRVVAAESRARVFGTTSEFRARVSAAWNRFLLGSMSVHPNIILICHLSIDPWVGMLTTCFFLAHRSRRLTRWAYRMGLEPASVRACVHACVHTFKHEYLRDQQADYNQILSEASLGSGKGCIRFWCRSDQISGFHGNG